MAVLLTLLPFSYYQVRQSSYTTKLYLIIDWISSLPCCGGCASTRTSLSPPKKITLLPTLSSQGYPPALITKDKDCLLQDVPISKGATCIVKLPANSSSGSAAVSGSVRRVGTGAGSTGGGGGAVGGGSGAGVAGGGGGVKAAAATGVCPACTYVNPPTAKSCEMCTGPLPSAAASAASTLLSAAATGASWDFEVEKIPDDNSCLFHAVAFLVGKARCTAPELRAMIVDAVKADPTRWNAATLGKPVAEYCSFILNPIRWGGQVELAIFAEIFQSEISVTEIQSGREDVYGQGQGA